MCVTYAAVAVQLVVARAEYFIRVKPRDYWVIGERVDEKRFQEVAVPEEHDVGREFVHFLAKPFRQSKPVERAVRKIDLVNGKLNAELSDEEFDRRRTKAGPPKLREVSGYLRRYRQLVSSAATGAILKG